MSETPYAILSPRQPVARFRGRCALAIMAKVPRAGEVKTRLTPPLKSGQAAALNIAFLKDTIACLKQAGAAVAADPVVSYTPEGEEAGLLGIVPVDVALLPQRGQGFGERLRWTAEDLLAVGFGAVCLIDSDSPTVPVAAYIEAARRLLTGRDSVVLGPSHDGGYYLLGLNAPHPRLFEEISWSSEQVAEQTRRRARDIGIPVFSLPAWYDVDDRRTLARLYRDLAAAGAAQEGFAAPHTAEYLQTVSGQLGDEFLTLLSGQGER